MNFARIDQRPIARWWWTVDRWSLTALGMLVGFGLMLSLAASPSVAERIGYDGLHFVRRHLIMLPLAMGLLFAVSLQPPRMIRRIAVIGFAAEQKLRPGFPGNIISIVLFLTIAGMLIKQPDIGMAAVVAIVWFAQFFMAGLRLYWVVAGSLAGLGSLAGAYLYLPHVRSRIDHFLDPSGGDSYQVKRSIEAFANGGLWGKGPGEGTVKDVLPDAHADFVFAVAGEEFGLVVCLVIIGLFAFIVLRGFSRLLQEGSLFVLVAATGLLIQFGLQEVINMASNLHLIPTKGMTLPFLSYGGSSMLALGIGMGMMLALTRRRLAGSEL